MPLKIFITRQIPEAGIKLLKQKKYQVKISSRGRVLQKSELISHLKKDKYDALLCLLTDKIDGEVIDAAGKQLKIIANYAVGFDNIDLQAAKEHGIMVTNTPEVLTETVAEHTFALMLAIAHRISEADRFTRAGKYDGWAPLLLLGNDVSKKTLGIIGLGRIGSAVASHAVKGFKMRILYYDVRRDIKFEKEFGAQYRKLPTIFRDSDFITIHVPLLPVTRHLIGAKQFRMMKKTAYLVNTSRGPIIDEKALYLALKNNIIKGAALDVFEFEPKVAAGLDKLDNVILTPHIASATEETRSAMSELAAKNIIAALSGKKPPNLVKGFVQIPKPKAREI